MRTFSYDLKPDFKSLLFDNRKIPVAENIEIELFNALADSKGVIREMCSHILNAGGKRIRPLLVLYSGMIFGEPTKELIETAVAAELIHMASLVHDDIIDESTVRRNQPSINKIWGNHYAVLCGDYLFAKAFGILAENRHIYGIDLMGHAIQNMCYGEILQADDKFNNDVSIEAYYERISKKTAIFLECCCKSGAFIAGASELQVQIIGEYGLNLGLSFQIIDDILDFCGDVNIMGKPKCEDLSQGNITLPVILMLKDEKHRQSIMQIFQKKEFSKQVIDNIVAILQETGAIKKSFEIALSHIEKSKHCLSLLPESKYISQLHKITDMLAARMN